MRRSDKVIITCAITGGVHAPSMSPYLPITPAQIAAESLAAAEAGAAMIHRRCSRHALHQGKGQRPFLDVAKAT